uniref:Uncharacterized protein n=1 Tax=Arundo donax TaxID=35708 RepID=A0A0A8XPP1_ARUDO
MEYNADVGAWFC